MTPTARALADLRRMGFVSWVVEATIANKFKRDLFNCIDILAIKGTTTLAIQVTSGDHHAERVQKVLANQYLSAMLAANWEVEVWSYRKSTKDGWTLRTERIHGQTESTNRETAAVA